MKGKDLVDFHDKNCADLVIKFIEKYPTLWHRFVEDEYITKKINEDLINEDI